MSEGTRADAATAAGSDEAVWALAGYVDAENLAPVRAGDVMYPPGTEVWIDDDHEMYGGSKGVVQAVGKGTGDYAGGLAYDVLCEGTSEAERFAEHDVTA